MKILHTSDLHLQEENDRRWQALEEIISTAKNKKVEVVVISGDLFDKDVNSEQLRGKIRPIFSDVDFDILLLPGNHDANSYRKGLHFGDGVTVFNEFKKPVEYPDEALRFWGLPFTRLNGEELLEKIQLIEEQIPADSWKNILLYHGQIQHHGYRSSDFGKEGKQQYMPLKLSYLTETSFDYVLAGHYHSRYRAEVFNENSYFIYPGSPVPINRSETGPRTINLLDPHKEFEREKCRLQLDLEYFENINIFLQPTDETGPLNRLQQKLEELPASCRGLVEIEGFFNGEKIDTNEKQLREKLDELENNNRKIERIKFTARDSRGITDGELYKKFVNLLENKEIEDNVKEKARKLTLQALVEVSR
ncbi:MAG: metallophosphoesterase family protein [bacterium]